MVVRARTVQRLLASGGSAAILASLLLVAPVVPAASVLGADPLTIDSSGAAPGSVAKFGIYEKTFQLSRAYGPSDVNDPAMIDVTAHFVGPSGHQVVVPAWYGKDYEVQPGTGSGANPYENYMERSPDAVWHVRFSPDEVGTWTYTLRAADHVAGQEAAVESDALSFDATAATIHGQIERDPRDDRFLRYADGTPYLPMGENVAFQQGEPVGTDGEHYVEPLFASMEAAGQNWTRIWMTDFNRNALEWSSGHWAGWYTGVGEYAGQAAFRIERQLDLAAEHGLHVQLVINDHGQFSSRTDGRWAENPYSDANGGPVPAAHPEAFFTDAEARRLFKERLRYLVARYGAYRNLLAWELFNEVQFVGSDTANPGSPQVRDDIVAWHAEMAAYLRSIDPYHHMITTSSDIDSSLKDIWADPNIDLVQVHDYDPALTTRDTRFAGYVDSLNAAYHKPVIIAEFGINGDREVNFDPVASAPLDANEEHLLEATHLHNAAWAAAMSGSGAMSWWWGAYIAASPDHHRGSPEFPANERIYPPLQDFFAGEDPAGMGLHRSTVFAPPEIVALGMDNGAEGFLWIRDAANEYGTGSRPGDLEDRKPFAGSIYVNGFPDGQTYHIKVYDPWGERTPVTQYTISQNGGLYILVPPFERDIAMKFEPGPRPLTTVGTGTFREGHSIPVTFDFDVHSDPQAVVDGTIRFSRGGTSLHGQATCLSVGTEHSDIVVGGTDDGTGTSFTIHAMPGNSGLGSVAIGTISTTAPADCGEPHPTEWSLDQGEVVLLDWPSYAGETYGSGTYRPSPGVTRSFGFYGRRTDDGTVSGTYAWQDATSSRAGTVDCLDFRAGRTTIIGHGPDPGHPSGPDITTSILIDDAGGFNNDRIWINDDSFPAPLHCMAAASSSPVDPLTGTTVSVVAEAPVAGRIRAAVFGGQPFQTHPAADDDHPLVATITTTGVGLVTVDEGTSGTPPLGSTYLAPQLSITAPGGTAALPLTVALTMDRQLLASADPDLTASTVAVFRNGALIDDCTTSTADPPATPDPCVISRETLSGGEDEGDVRLTILTSQASTWNAGTAPTQTVPGAPGDVTAAKGDKQATVTWSAPASDGFSPITGYTVTSTPGNKTATVGGDTFTATVTGLTNGTSYTFKVAATNAIGTGPASAASNAVTPVVPASQTITFTNPGTRATTPSPINTNASASSGLPVTLDATTPSVCFGSGTQIYLVGAGSCSITATQPGNADFKPAPPVTRTFTVNLSTQTITFTKPANQVLTTPSITVTATASSGLSVTLTSTTPSICSVSGLDVSLLAVGACSLTASQAGDAIYKPATSVTRTFTIDQASQTITFPKPANQLLTTPSIRVTATSSAGLPVTVTSTTPAICTVNGLDVALVAPGTCSLTASQPGNVQIKPATSVTRTFSISQATQTITFANPGAHTLLQTPFTVTATTSSGLPVTLTSTTTAVCQVSGFDVTLLTAGSCSLTASQAGTPQIKAAASVTRAFNVTKASQTITIPDPGPQSMAVPTLVLTPFASSGLPVTLSSSSTTICTLSGDTVTLKKAGTCKIKGVQAGDATYAAAPAVTLNISVAASGSPLGFIVASGDRLKVGGASGPTFVFNGASIYGTSNPGAPNDPAATVALAIKGGLNSLRVVNMFEEANHSAGAPTRESDWVRVDRIIARARGAGLRVVLDLSAFRNYLVRRDIAARGWEANCVDNGDRSVVDYGAIDPYRAGLAGEWQAFLDFVVNRVNTVNGARYKNDPAIAVISLAGEPEPPGTEECGKAVSGQDLTDFYARTLGYLASIDPTHLRSNGGLQKTDWEHLYGGSSGIDGEAIFALAANTLPSLHTHPPALDGNGDPIDYQTPDLGPVANALDKPWFTEEFGWLQNVGDATRAAWYQLIYDEQATYGSDGILVWNLGFEVDGNSNDVNPSTPQAWGVVVAQ